jgi:hypothetical protein
MDHPEVRVDFVYLSSIYFSDIKEKESVSVLFFGVMNSVSNGQEINFGIL